MENGRVYLGRSGGAGEQEPRVGAENRDKIGPEQACCIELAVIRSIALSIASFLVSRELFLLSLLIEVRV